MGLFFFCMILLSSAVSAATVNVTPGSNSIKNAIDSANSGDTLSLAEGTYYEHDLNVNKSLTIAGPQTSGTPKAVIDGSNQGRVFNITSGATLNLLYLTIINGNASKDTTNQNGGGILNNGTLTVTNCNIQSSQGNDGGGIYNQRGTVTVTGSNINGNTATNSGGGIHNYYGTLTVTGSNVNGNNAGYGGGIYNYYGSCYVASSSINSNTAANNGGGLNSHHGTFTIINSNINGNTGAYGGGVVNWYGNVTVAGSNLGFNRATKGNALYNTGTTTTSVHFNSLNNPGTGYEIYSDSGPVDAQYNWWGSNLDPSSKVYGTIDTNPWMILKISSASTLIGKGKSTTVNAFLTYDSNGAYHNPSYGYIQDGMPVKFTTDLGSITSWAPTVYGAAKATLTGGSVSGTTIVTAGLGDEFARTWVNVDAIAPKVISTTPKNGATGISRISTIAIKFSKNIKASTYWSKIYVKNLRTGKKVGISKKIVGNTLYIKTTTTRASYTWYQVYIPGGAVKDYANNNGIAYSLKFKTRR